jgi:hypothetical protein
MLNRATQVVFEGGLLGCAVLPAANLLGNAVRNGSCASQQ